MLHAGANTYAVTVVYAYMRTALVWFVIDIGLGHVTTFLHVSSADINTIDRCWGMCRQVYYRRSYARVGLAVGAMFVRQLG